MDSNGVVARRRRPGLTVLRIFLVILLCLAVVAATIGVLWQQGMLSLAGRCMSSSTVTVVASPAVEPALNQAVAKWNATRPTVDGACLTARTVVQESGQAAAAVGPGWDPARDGGKPDVWVPDSSVWLSVAGSRPEAAALLTAEGTSIASSPAVLALRKPMAGALGWPQKQLGRQDVIGALSQPDVWAKAGHPEYANARVGLTDPATSTAGLASVLSILDPTGTGELGEQQLIAGLQVSRVVGGFAPDASVFFAAQTTAAAVDPNSVVAAFPALEKEVAEFNAANPGGEMAPVYDPQQTFVADFPFVPLTADWVSERDRAAVAEIREYLTGAEARAILARHYLRTPDGAVADAAVLPSEGGYPATPPAARAAITPERLSQVMAAWADLQRKVNLLVVLDTSGSMTKPVPGTQLNRLALLQQTAGTGFNLLPHTMSIGLWEFSGRGGEPHRELVPFGPYPAMAGAVPRAQALTQSVGQLRAEGDTPLYDTVYDAFKTMQKQWEAGSTNSVVIITDGANEVATGLTLAQLTEKLGKEQIKEKPVQVVTIAVGPDADAESLEQVASAAGGRNLVLREPGSAIETLVLAFTGRLQ
ncbi:VWA domain-containing protein [Catenuloplanes indicus]|uniref:Ca-activated chloride channel family protein n=1 Tax=Catenuloplanes indicus TaxID=137267 RepID=A0AAE3W525_9ACTN|nr:VWA domain-containing protein [Catenuloplanes indicus]MDQ0370078.1 Ca-activated chloride channel family protein [Catenuloplanes indicus]